MTGNTSTRRPRPALRLRTAVLALAALLAAGAADALAGPIETARKAAEAGDWKAAAQSFSEVLDKTPDDREAALGLADAAIRGGLPGYFTPAEDSLFLLRDRNKRDFDVLVALGRISIAVGATKSNTLARKSYDAQALESFAAAAEIKPKAQAPVVGQARVHYESAYFDKAVEIVDAFLARNPPVADEALYWKGQALYLKASDAYKRLVAGSPLTDEIRSLFTKAQGAYEASARANPKSYDTMIQLAYASAWLGAGARDTARDAYLKAAVLKPDSPYPFMGLKTLHQNDQDALTKLLTEFVAKHPKHPQAIWAMATDRYVARDWKAAAEHYKRYAACADDPAGAWLYLGKAYDGLQQADKAAAAYWKALETNPEDVQAAWELEKRIQKTDPMARARQSVKGAREVIAEYAKILEAAPKNHNVRNNLAFTLREAYVAHQGSKEWVPILMESVKYYVEASDLLGEFTAEKERTVPYPTRHAQAQVISDTGLMFQFYEPTRDLDKAILYYERALEYSEDGYWDAFNNLRQILAHLKRWDDLWDLCMAAADGIKTDRGAPDTARRANAKQTADKLVADGLVKD